MKNVLIGPLQLVIHVVQNRHAGEQKSHWDKTYIINGNFLCLSCPSATFSLQHGSFVPHEWLATKGLLHACWTVEKCIMS